MPGGQIQERPLPYFILNEAEPSGRTIGYLGDVPIAEAVTDCFGKSYVYVGLAPRTWGGDIDVDALKRGEFILPPNLVYRLCSPPRASSKLAAMVLQTLWRESRPKAGADAQSTQDSGSVPRHARSR